MGHDINACHIRKLQKVKDGSNFIVPRDKSRLESLELGKVNARPELFELCGASLLLLLLELHPPVLEPDLDLPLRQAQRMRQLCAPRARQEMVVVKLLKFSNVPLD